MRAVGRRRTLPMIATGSVALSCMAVLALSASGCGDGVPGAGTILLTIHYGDDVTPAQRMSATGLSMAVDGAEQYEKRASVGNLLTDRVATLRYHPRATAGTLEFTITVDDGKGVAVAAGRVSVAIDVQREVVGDVTLRATIGMVDGGADMPPPDLVMADMAPIDMSLVDAAMRDIATVDVAMADMARPDLVMADMVMVTDGPAPDMAMMMPDLAMPDMVIPPDLTTPDMAIPPDLVVIDLTPPPDLVVPPDLSMKPDLAGPVMISHTAEKFINNAGDLVAAVATIDTTTNKPNPLLDKNNVPIPLPANATITYDMMSRSMILHIGGWTVAKNNDIKVVGMNQLIVLAAGAVTISARINASAVKQVPGPGGVPANSGTGRGVNGIGPNATNKTGGGGAGFAVPGAAGGDSDSQSGGSGGAAYGGMVMDWEGGSGGGNGGSNMVQCDLAGGPTGGFGGGGGGSIQITSATGITIDATGSIDVNGGGGQAGCLWTSGGSPRSMGGGGGGSGGVLFLEAPTVTVSGSLFANGGGGGGGGDVMGLKPGVDGQDGQSSAMAAAGGASSGNGGFGGAGGTDVAPKGSPTSRIGLQGGGGGGGAAGRILFHVRAAAMVSGTVSPMPTSFVNL